MDNELKAITEIIAKSLGITPEALHAKIDRNRQHQETRVDNANARYERALRRVTGAQAKKIEELVRGGASMHSKIRQDRASGNIVMFAQQQKWDSAKGRMGCQLYAVYPDGSVVTTFERSISVKASF